jgi:PAS domain S-box-containing protein
VTTSLRLLHLEKYEGDAALALALLAEEGFSCQTTRVPTLDGFSIALEDGGPFDLILSDLSSVVDGHGALALARNTQPGVPFIFLTGTGGAETVVEALKSGASDYVIKGRLSRLAPAVQRALAEARERAGKVAGVVEMVEDVTKGKQAEEELRHSHELLRAVIAASPLATVLLDPEGRVIIWNAAAERIFGWREAEVLGHYLPSVPESKRREFADLRSRVMGGEFLAGVEIRRRNKNGSVVEVSLHAAPVFNAEGTVVAMMSVMADISERKRIEGELQESERRFRAAFEDAAIGMCLTGPDGRFLTVNRVFGAMLGYTPEELTALDLFQVTYPEDRLKSRRWIEGMLAGEPLPTQMEKRFVTREGAVVWGMVSKNLLRDGSGAPLYFVNQIQDITERKHLGLQLLHAQKMEAVGTLAGGIAHDFNNLLTAIVGYGTLLEMRIDPQDPLAGHVGKILATADRAAALTQSLLAFSRKRTIEPHPVDLNRLVQEVGELLRRVLREDIELRTNLHDDPVTGHADSGQVEQILINLATNARDAMPTGGLLEVTTAMVDIDESFVAAHSYGVPGRYALLAVADNGRGMDEPTRKRIFEPFYTTKDVGKGSGLGLAIVYGIVKQHQGFINCYSEPDRGTIFRIYLPAAEGAIESVPPALSAPPTGGAETILLAEDDPWVRSLTREVLERFGYTVIEAADGEEAVACLQQHGEKIDLALLDVIMPRRNGREALAAMREFRPGLPALFTSGYTADILQLPGLQSQEARTGFLSKPVAPAELLRAVRKLLDQAEAG